MHACIHTYIHTHIHTYIHMHSYIYIHTHTYIYIHTLTYIHIHTHIHTYIHMYNGPRNSCKVGCKKLDIKTVTSSYIFLLIMFVVRNPHHFETKSSICRIHGTKNHYNTISDIFFISNCVTYSSIKIFNKLPLNVSKLHGGSITLKFALRKTLVKNYS
jgi:hypothetical protein